MMTPLIETWRGRTGSVLAWTLLALIAMPAWAQDSRDRKTDDEKTATREPKKNLHRSPHRTQRTSRREDRPEPRKSRPHREDRSMSKTQLRHEIESALKDRESRSFHSSDLEQRMDSLEKKLDTILKTMKERPARNDPTDGPPRHRPHLRPSRDGGWR